MAIQREVLRQVGHVMRPMARRIVSAVARGVVRLVDDSTKMQLVQLGMVAGETIDGAEHFQSYGFSSVPLAGAEHVTIFPDGDHSHPLTIVVSDRRYKPTGRNPGDVTMYHYKGARITMTVDGDIVAQPAPGRKVLLGDAAASSPPMLTNDGAAFINAIAAAILQVPAAATGPAELTALKNALTAAGWPVGATKVVAE